MDSEIERQRLIELLRSSYRAGLVNNLSVVGEIDPRRIVIDDKVLKRYGFDHDDIFHGSFWNVLCPALQGEGIIKSYERKMPEVWLVGEQPEYFYIFNVNEKKLGIEQHHDEPVIISETPEGANWQSLQVRFINGRTILATFPMSGWHRDIAAAELGLEKKIGQQLRRQWELLQEAAGANGLISLPADAKKKESKRRQINELQQLLRRTFPKLNGEPLEPRGGDAYLCVFEIKPEQQEDEMF